MRAHIVTILVTASLAVAIPLAQEPAPLRTPAQTAIDTLIQNEQFATLHRGRYAYVSVEKSDRTGFHTWTERLVETQWGRVRYLIAEDGKPITGERLAAEKSQLAGYAADPDAL